MTIGILIGVLAAIALSYIAITLLPALLVKRRAMRRLSARSRGRLALTYDDGPGPSLTPPLLDLLDRYGAKATFFFVGFRAERFPAVCDAIKARGHEIGCHTHMHRNAWKTLPWKAYRDVTDGYHRMSRWMPHNALFRPAFGKLTTWNWLAADKGGAPVCFWTCDGGDTHEVLPDPELVARRLVRAGGGVVLLHSHDRRERSEERQAYVLAVTEQLLQAARANNYEVCVMSKLVEHKSTNQQINKSIENVGSAQRGFVDTTARRSARHSSAARGDGHANRH